MVSICAAILVTMTVTKVKPAQAELRAQETTAVQRAIEIARHYGLTQNRPDKFAVKQTTLAEWFSIIDFEPGADASKLGLDPNRPIWIVSMKGSIDWVGPGRRGGPGDKFDNISVALSLDSSEHLGTFSAAPDQPLPLNLQR